MGEELFEMSLREVRIVGIGKSLPGKAITNEYLLDHCNLTDNDKWTKEKALKWTTEKLGIETRYVARDYTDGRIHTNAPYPGYENSTLCANAIRNALENAHMPKDEVDMIIVATATPDYPIPGTSPIVQEKLDIKECAVLDVRSACCGSLTAVITAMQYLRSGFFKTIAVCGSDVGSIFGNLDKDSPNYERQDFVNAMMIGDGAGALILRGFAEDEEKYGIEILYAGLSSIGVGKKPGMWLPLGGSIYPGTPSNIEKGLSFFKHDYRAVLEHGPILFTSALRAALKGANLTIPDIDLFVPHQANGKVAELAPKFGVPKERMFQNFHRVGNTANASVLLCLADIAEENKLREGAYIVVASAESTKWLHASLVLKWTSMTGEKNTAIRVRDPFYQRIYSRFAFFAVTTLLRLRSLTRIFSWRS